MANQLYSSWLQHLMETYFGVAAHFTDNPIMDVFVCGVSDGYVFNSDHTEVEDLGLNVTMEPVALADITLTDGVFKCAVTETNTDDQIGNEVHALVIFVANEDGSRLMAYIDSGQPTQLPLVLVNGKFFFRWNAAGIFRI